MYVRNQPLQRVRNGSTCPTICNAWAVNMPAAPATLLAVTALRLVGRYPSTPAPIINTLRVPLLASDSLMVDLNAAGDAGEVEMRRPGKC